MHIAMWLRHEWLRYKCGVAVGNNKTAGKDIRYIYVVILATGTSHLHILHYSIIALATKIHC